MMRRLHLMLVVLWFECDQVSAQIAFNSLGIVHYAPNCSGIFVERIDTFRVAAKAVNLPEKNSSGILLNTRCTPASRHQEPLIIVDGLIFEYSNLDVLNPNDIISINILKYSETSRIFHYQPANDMIIITTNHSKVNKFQVKDIVDGKPIPKATFLIVSDKNANEKLIFIGNDSGTVTIRKLSGWQEYELTISAVGFKSRSMKITNRFTACENEILLERDYKNCSEITISSKSTRSIRCKSIRCRFAYTTLKNNEMSNNFLTSHFTVYPNPAQSSSTLNVRWNRQQTGNHSFELFNQSGQLIFRRETYIDKNARVLGLTIPAVTPGNYFIRITNKTSGKTYTEKIIVSE